MTFQPVTQIRTGYGRGQCTEASIASLLGVPLEAVPELWAGPHVPPDASADEHQPLANRIRMWEWLKAEHGVMLCGVRLARPTDDSVEAWRRACGVITGIGDHPWARYHLFSGLNPTGIGHYVVGELGRVVWDPNPSRAGLRLFEDVQWLVPLDLVPDDARHLPAAEWREEDCS